jgi:hypothetical protein
MSLGRECGAAAAEMKGKIRGFALLLVADLAAHAL